QKKVVLNWVKEFGMRSLPSLGTMKKYQSYLQDLIGDSTKKVMSHSGNMFYINSVARAIAKDYANPLTCLAMQDYPEDDGKRMSQVFNGSKMLFDLPSLPAVQVDRTMYFMDELLQESLGGYFIPKLFFLAAADIPTNTTESCKQSDKGHLCNVYWCSNVYQARFIVSDNEEIIPMSMFVRSFGDIVGSHVCLVLLSLVTIRLKHVIASSVRYVSLSPNPLREKSKGQMVYTVPSIIMDDVSGNILRQWNKRHDIYMSNANLPQEMLEKEFFVQFVSSSPHAPPMELM
ncbi:uncharacterized protein HD556DRAFT_1250464, partial [Suillus plorans]